MSARRRELDAGNAHAAESEPWRGHIPALDGVRGFAIALVMVCHIVWRSTPTAFVERGLVAVLRTGWVGVDLFFVLSGYLITGILLDSRGAPNYFRNFYIRRTLRIFPLYYAILAGVFLIAPLAFASVRQQAWFDQIDQSQLWFWTYTSNLLLAREGHWSVAGVLGHYWSLAIEEQFYVVWPAVVLLLSPRQLRFACGAIMLAALGLRTFIATGPAHDLAAFTLMPARADTLVAGAWLAAALRTGVRPDTVRRYARWLLGATVVAMGALVVHYRGLSEVDVLTETIGFTCLALGFAATVSLALDTPRRPTLVGGFFRNSTLRVLGKYSYAMYCVHPLIQDLLRAAGIDAARMPMVRGLVLPGVAAYGALVLTLTLGVSYASWHLMEKHFLGLKARFTDGGEIRPA